MRQGANSAQRMWGYVIALQRELTSKEGLCFWNSASILVNVLDCSYSVVKLYSDSGCYALAASRISWKVSARVLRRSTVRKATAMTAVRLAFRAAVRRRSLSPLASRNFVAN